jgi:glycosyltransferase involved in cell wall biosynthesis
MTFAYSVVIPAFNASPTIGDAIRSTLSQTRPPEAVIVVDDGSTDDTAAVAAAVRGPIDVIHQDNRGPGAATNAGIRRVATPFFATLDSDDLWLPEKIERQAAVFAAEPDVAGVFTLARLFADGEVPDPNGKGAIRRLWTRTTLLFRTDAARAVGEFTDLPGRLGEVIDWLARSRDLGQRHVMVEEILAMRRIRPGSLSYRADAERSRGYLAAVRDALERKKRMAARPETGPAS